MAGEKGAGEDSPQPRLLDPVQIGRMIRRLQGEYLYTYHGSWRQWRTRAGRRFTDEQIREALCLDKAQFNYCLGMVRAQFPRQWTQDKVHKAFVAFVNKHKRWPTPADYRNWRVTGLPLRETAQNWVGIDVLIRTYVTRNPKRLTPQMVMTIPNVTDRRDAIDVYGGEEKILRDGGGVRIQQDDFGTVWELPVRDGGDATMRYVEVVNSTPQKNLVTGEVITDQKGNPIYDHYFLRIPPTISTGKAAIAWGFSMAPSEFAGFAAES